MTMKKNPNPLKPSLARYVDYINNTGQVPLKTEHFDEDWEPAGPMIRQNLRAGGYITEGPAFISNGELDCSDGIRLRPDLVRRA